MKNLLSVDILIGVGVGLCCILVITIVSIRICICRRKHEASLKSNEVINVGDEKKSPTDLDDGNTPS